MDKKEFAQRVYLGINQKKQDTDLYKNENVRILHPIIIHTPGMPICSNDCNKWTPVSIESCLQTNTRWRATSSEACQ